MKLKCKDCGFVCDKSEIINNVKPDQRGLAASCPECDNPVFYRHKGSKRTICQGGFTTHYK